MLKLVQIMSSKAMFSELAKECDIEREILAFLLSTYNNIDVLEMEGNFLKISKYSREV